VILLPAILRCDTPGCEKTCEVHAFPVQMRGRQAIRLRPVKVPKGWSIAESLFEDAASCPEHSRYPWEQVLTPTKRPREGNET
jgi:hypothetical protein